MRSRLLAPIGSRWLVCSLRLAAQTYARGFSPRSAPTLPTYVCSLPFAVRVSVRVVPVQVIDTHDAEQ